mgnify:CR=1 FL=1
MWNGCCIQPFHHHFIFEAFQKKDFVKRTKNPWDDCIICIWQVPHLTFLPNIVKSSMLTKGLDLLCDICPYGLETGLTVTFSRIKSNSQQNFSCKAAYFSLAWIKTLGYSDLFFQRIVGMHEMPTLRTQDYTRTSTYSRRRILFWVKNLHLNGILRTRDSREMYSTSKQQGCARKMWIKKILLNGTMYEKIAQPRSQLRLRLIL